MGIPSGIIVKLERAKLHLSEVEARVEALPDACRDRVVFDIDGESGDRVYRLAEVPPIDPSIGAVVGDFVHNLRSVLDHLADALVRRFGGHPSRDTGFPICRKRPPGGLAIRAAKPPSLPPNVAELLEQVQPYMRDEPELHQLYVLNQLDIVDKHRQMLLAVFRNRLTTWDAGGWTVTDVFGGPYEAGSLVARMARVPDEPPGKPRPRFHFHVGLDEAAIGVRTGTDAVVNLLRGRLLYYVERRVLARFDPHL
jgi:hypothetical protein